MIENNINEISPSNSSRSSSKKGNFAQIRSNLKSNLFSIKPVLSPFDLISEENQLSNLKLTLNSNKKAIHVVENPIEKKHGIYYIYGNFKSMYNEGKKLGEGCVGLVKKVRRISDSQIFAVKIVQIKDEESIYSIKKEFMNLKPLDHPNIVKMHELYIDLEKNQIFLIMDYVQAKEMFKMLKKNGSYTESLASKIFKQILNAIQYMHTNGICHRDLKPNNILCNLDGSEVKITDFNVSKFDNNFRKKDKFGFGREKIKMWTYTGTIAFSAPEIFLETEYNESVDMWSAGVVLYTMLCGYQPFQADYVTDLISQIIAVKYEFNSDLWDQISTSAKDLISRCLTKDPKERISPSDALMHPWIAHKKAPTNILPQKILENLHRNYKRLTRVKLFEEGPDIPVFKKRTMTENAEKIEKTAIYGLEMKNSNRFENKADDSPEEVIEQRAISCIEEKSFFFQRMQNAIILKSPSDQLEIVNDTIAKSLEEKENEYTSFYENI